MGYRIVYGVKKPQSMRGGNRILRLQMMTACFFLFGCVLAKSLWPEGTQVLREILLPGELSAAEQAFSRLVVQLRNGEPMGEAVESFCRYVIVNGTQR